ncbi:hypothetical protein ABPG75_001737 [Micractinium tetrahymenae]
MLAGRRSLLLRLSSQLGAAQEVAQPACLLSSDATLMGRLCSLLGVAGQHQAAAVHTSTHRQRDAEQSSAQAAAEQPEGRKVELDRKALVNRMLYRSRQRGFLELDLLIGMWAEREVPRMSASMVGEFEAVLDQENPDMFKWLTAQEEAPEELQRNRAFQALQAHVKAMTDKHHSVPAAPGAAPKEWLRGWTDKGEELAPKPAQGL